MTDVRFQTHALEEFSVFVLCEYDYSCNSQMEQSCGNEMFVHSYFLVENPLHHTLAYIQSVCFLDVIPKCLYLNHTKTSS